MAPITRHHAEWLSLMDVSGPFLSISVLKDVFPNGLDSHDSVIAAELRAAHDAWSDPAAAGYDDPEAVHRAFVDFVFERMLGFRKSDLLRDEKRLKSDFATSVPMHSAMLVPDAVVLDGEEARLLVTVATPSIPVDQPVPGSDWSATPRERMVEMLRGTGCPLGLVTDGERWTLVTRREGEAPGYATWWASLWREEKITLQSFRTLLGAQRFFSVPDQESLAGLLDRSAEDQSEVTTKLGNQTLEAVEILVRTLDQLDRDRGGELLRGIPEPELYDAAVTVMMRLVVLFFAEENDLLPMSEDLWDSQYAASSLRSRLQRAADEGGEEVLEAHSDAWPRLLATWRAVYGGIEHAHMRLAPYGGSLFDPDQYPFLEGRLRGTAWEDADPLPVDNRTVLHLLSALQTLYEGGQRRKLSFRALDVEQIGHVYEGMLDHTAARAEGWVLGLSGTGGKEPEIPLEEFEGLDDEALAAFLADRTGRNVATIVRWLAADATEEMKGRFGTHWAPAFSGDAEAAKRIQRFAKFVRVDSFGAPTVFQPGSVYVCDSSHRGATGTHYTPRSLTEEMVTETLDPLVYDGIAEGKPETEWKLRTPSEILALNVGDPACGSGAFLVQACRYLSAKLVESRRVHGELDHDSTEEDLTHARREVAGRCLYGVDVNPMAVEMAKLSLWLVTLERDKPFSFLDHAIGVGDSLVGVTSLDQLRHWNLAGEGDPQEMITGLVAGEIEKALELRRKLVVAPVVDIQDVEHKQRLLAEARKVIEPVMALADLLFAPSFAADSASEVAKLRDSLLHFATNHLSDSETLRRGAAPLLAEVGPFHWVLEFPEVMERGGFDAIVGNPPFQSGQEVTATKGDSYNAFLAESIPGYEKRADLSAAFLRRSAMVCSDAGHLSLLATNTISEGVTRRSGLEPLVAQGWQIRVARSGFRWPRGPSVIAASVCMTRNTWRGPRLLDGESVSRIGVFLKEGLSVAVGSVRSLAGNAGICFQGSGIWGEGFFLDDETAVSLIRLDARNSKVVRRAIGGRELNDGDTEGRRWVFDFGEMPMQEASTFVAPFALLESRVREWRQALDSRKYARVVESWWKYFHGRIHLYSGIQELGLRRVIARSRVSDHHMLQFVNSDVVFLESLSVFLIDDDERFGVLQSFFHDAWVRQFASRLKKDVRYGVKNCFLSFPFPDCSARRLATASVEYQAAREELCDEEAIGLTKAYNLTHEKNQDSEVLSRFRIAIQELDHVVADAYGASGLDLSRHHQMTKQGWRFIPSQQVRVRILEHLTRMNFEVFVEEVEKGRHLPKVRTAKLVTDAAGVLDLTVG